MPIFQKHRVPLKAQYLMPSSRATSSQLSWNVLRWAAETRRQSASGVFLWAKITMHTKPTPELQSAHLPWQPERFIHWCFLNPRSSASCHLPSRVPCISSYFCTDWSWIKTTTYTEEKKPFFCQVPNLSFPLTWEMSCRVRPLPVSGAYKALHSGAMSLRNISGITV